MKRVVINSVERARRLGRCLSCGRPSSECDWLPPPDLAPYMKDPPDPPIYELPACPPRAVRSTKRVER